MLLTYYDGIVTRVANRNMSTSARISRADTKLAVGLVEAVSGVTVFLDLILDTFTGGVSLFFVEIDALAVVVLFVQTSGLNEFLETGFIGVAFLPFFRCLCGQLRLSRTSRLARCGVLGRDLGSIT